MASKKKAEPSPRHGKVRKSEDGTAAFEQGEAAAPAPKLFDAEAVATELGNAHWNPASGDSFLLRGNDGRWQPWGTTAVVDKMRGLAGRMIAIKARESEMLSEAKRVLLWIRENRALDGVLQALSGYPAGVHDLETSERLLVKSGPKLVHPEEGEWPVIRGLVEALLDCSGKTGGIDQTPWFWSWCKVAYESLINGSPGNWMQGHAMVLTGPPGCGKNRLQEQLITGLLGGRKGNPTKYLFGEDEYNSDVFAAEHLMMSEIPSSQKTVDRVAFAERIKQVVANSNQRARLMKTDPSTLYPYWRLTVSVNDDQDTLSSLPIVTSGYGDKILIFHCQAAPLPILCEEEEELAKRARFRQAIADEMPAFAHWLLHGWKIPDELLVKTSDGRDPRRFGFKEFHHPVIRGELFDDTPAAQLLRLVDMAEFWRGAADLKMKLWDLPCHVGKDVPKGLVWWERAETLQQLLTGDTEYHCSMEIMAKKLFAHNACGRLLGRLASDESTGGPEGRVMKADTRLWKGWMIAPPKL